MAAALQINFALVAYVAEMKRSDPRYLIDRSWLVVSAMCARFSFI